MDLKLLNDYKENESTKDNILDKYSNNINYNIELDDIDNFIPFPIYSYNYKKLLFTDDSNCLDKYTLYMLLPFSFIADLFMYIPRKIRNFIKNKYRKFKQKYN